MEGSSPEGGRDEKAKGEEVKEDEGEDGLDGVDDAIMRVQHGPKDGGDCSRGKGQPGRGKLKARNAPKRQSVMSSSIAGSSRAHVFFVSASGRAVSVSCARETTQKGTERLW